MTILRSFGSFAGAVALVLALAGCGDDRDGDLTATDETGSASAAADDMGESVDDSADQESGDDAEAGGPGSAQSDDGAGSEDGEPAAAPGVYRDYSPDAVADTSYDTTILFFHASWCPECRAFEQAIEDEGVPDGVQILKTDYDTEQELKEKYRITIQSSFVKVDPDGDELSTWFGYGEDKSVETILEQLG